MKKDFKSIIHESEKNQLIILTDDELCSAINDFQIYHKQFEIFDCIKGLDEASKSIFPYEFIGNVREDNPIDSNSKQVILNQSPNHNSDLIIAKKDGK